jgi:phage tail-like protein
MAENNRTYAAAHFSLELDSGDNVGVFRSIEGGSIKADVMTYQSGGTYSRLRQLGKPKYEDLKLQVGMGMTLAFYQWVEQFFAGEVVRRPGAIVAGDFYYKERARRTFTNAMLKELTFPKLDASDKSPVYMTIGMSVESIRFEPGSGRVFDSTTGDDKQVKWNACNFSFSVDGFESSCNRVTKVDSFTVKQTVIEYPVGGLRDALKIPSQMDYPNLVFYIPEADAYPFYQASTQRTIAGQQSGRLNGHIICYDNDGKALCTVEFKSADIVSVTPDKSDSASEEIKLVKIELYTETMDFSYADQGGMSI